MGKADIKKIDLNKADMHMHTNCSDGLLTPGQIVEMAKNKGLQTIAITDHDLVEGIEEALSAAKELGGITVIPGIELSTEGPECTELHILGYLIDPDNADLNEAIAALKKRRKDRNERLFAALQSQGIQICEGDFDKVPADGYIGKPMIAKKMIEKGYVSNIPQAFEKGRYLESPVIRAIKKEKLSVEEALRLIINSGGTPVLAHPMKIRNIGPRGSLEFWENLDHLLKDLSSWGLVGLECFYPDHTEAEISILLSMAERYGLVVTKGSDYHGYDY